MNLSNRIKSIFKQEHNEIETLKAEVSMGHAFENWCNSDVGQFIIGRAEQYRQKVLLELSETDPKDHIKLIQLQAESRIPGRLIQWIEDAIVRGESARFQLDEMRGTD